LEYTIFSLLTPIIASSKPSANKNSSSSKQFKISSLEFFFF
jgi:hypothetical protein